jgi:hypothetical protein
MARSTGLEMIALATTPSQERLPLTYLGFGLENLFIFHRL